MDGRFEAYSRTLFSRSASEVNRELQDKEANQKLDVSLNGYLRLLSGFFTTPAAFKSLEYLIRRYKIHVYNVNAAVTCALPYHSTPEFVKLVQLCNLEGTQFYFLKHVKEKGAAPPRDQLVVRCTHDGAFLSFVCQAAAAAASTKVSERAHTERSVFSPRQFINGASCHRSGFRFSLGGGGGGGAGPCIVLRGRAHPWRRVCISPNVSRTTPRTGPRRP